MYRKPRVLVADDESAITVLLFEILTHAGFEVLPSQGGLEALTLARAEKPHLILLDLMMPDLDGRDACRAIKMDRDLQQIPVVLFSSAEEQDVHWRAAGADAFLQKPFSVRELPGFVRLLIPDGGT